MALAQRRVGSLGTAPALLTAQTLAVAGCYPGPGRLRIDGVGVSDCVSNGRLIDTFWCVIGWLPHAVNIWNRLKVSFPQSDNG